MLTVHRLSNDAYRKRNYDLCTAIEVGKVRTILEEMGEEGLLAPCEVVAGCNATEALLNLLRAMNERATLMSLGIKSAEDEHKVRDGE